jgi:hypothetical protein
MFEICCKYIYLEAESVLFLTSLPMSNDSTEASDIENRNHVYNIEERSAIDVFKTKYMDATTSDGRKAIAQLDIFPALFNHWKSKGKVYREKDLRIKSNVCSTFNLQLV